MIMAGVALAIRLAVIPFLYTDWMDPFVLEHWAFGRIARSIASGHGFGSPLAEAEPFYRAYFAFFLASPEYAAPPYPKLYAWSMAELAGLAEAAV